MSEREQDEYCGLTSYAESYINDLDALGEGSLSAYNLWQTVSGQRIPSFSGPGDLDFKAVGWVMELYEVEPNCRLDMFERIRAIDKVMVELYEKKK